MALTKYTIDAASAIRAQKALVNAQKGYNAELDQSAKRLTKAERLGRKLAEKADPQKEYNRRLNELAGAVKRGEVAMGDASIEAARLQGRLGGVAKSGKKAFGTDVTATIGTYAASMLSVSSVVGVVSSLFSETSRQAQKAAADTRSYLDVIGELQQVGDPQGSHEVVQDIINRGITTDRKTAGDIAFQFKASRVFGDDRKFVLDKVATPKLVSAPNLPEFIAKSKKVQDVLGFATLEESMEKIVQASDATDSNATSVAVALTRYGASLKALKFDSDAGLAALTTTLRTAAKPEVAATQIQAFLTQVDSRGLAKGTLKETVLAIQKDIESGRSTQKILGEQNAITGFRAIHNQLPFFDQQLELIKTADDRNIIADLGSQARKIPTIDAASYAQQAKGQLSIARELASSERTNIMEAALDFRQVQLNNQGRRHAASALWFDGKVNGFFGNELGVIRSQLNQEIQRGEAGDGGAFSSEFERKMATFIDQQQETNETMRRLTEAIEDNLAGGGA